MRQAAAQTLHHSHYRAAFGKRLIDQPLMQNVLADLALESEAAVTLTMRIARALDQAEHDEHEKLLMRIGTAVGKYWICKRTPNHAYEAMECIGGSGVMEDSIMPRLFRESPINAIWEGSGNVQCLDVLRAMGKTPAVLDAFFAELGRAQGADPRLDQYVNNLHQEFTDLAGIEYRARNIVDQMALALQASLLVQTGQSAVAEGFIASRLTSRGQHHYGAMPKGVDCKSIIERAHPRLD